MRIIIRNCAFTAEGQHAVFNRVPDRLAANIFSFTVTADGNVFLLCGLLSSAGIQHRQLFRIIHTVDIRKSCLECRIRLTIRRISSPNLRLLCIRQFLGLTDRPKILIGRNKVCNILILKMDQCSLRII